MKRTFCLVTFALFSCLTLVPAAAPDPCTDKYNECVSHCLNLQSQCKLRGRDPVICGKDFDICKSNCEVKKNECLGKSNPKQSAPPKKSAPKQTTTTTTTAPTK